MLDVYLSSRFRKEYRLMLKRGMSAHPMEAVIDLLRAEQPLPEQYRDHELSGEYTGFRECHIKPDWLLIYRVEHDRLTLTLTRTGTHSDLF